jgi:hypothetical protein
MKSTTIETAAGCGFTGAVTWRGSWSAPDVHSRLRRIKRLPDTPLTAVLQSTLCRHRRNTTHQQLGFASALHDEEQSLSQQSLHKRQFNLLNHSE